MLGPQLTAIRRLGLAWTGQKEKQVRSESQESSRESVRTVYPKGPPREVARTSPLQGGLPMPGWRGGLWERSESDNHLLEASLQAHPLWVVETWPLEPDSPGVKASSAASCSGTLIR